MDLNTLLSFQEDLTPQEIGAISNQICEQIQAQGFAAGYETAMEKLREFPSCGLLCYQLAAVLRGALFLYAPEQTEAFQPKLDALFERAAQSEEREVREAALGMLVAGRQSRRTMNGRRSCWTICPTAGPGQGADAGQAVSDGEKV